MKAVILCAGYGTRLYPLTKDTSKPLLPIRGKPIIEYIVNKVQAIPSIDEIFVVTNKRFFDSFKDWADNYVHATPLRIVNDGSKNHKDRLGATGDFRFVVERQNINDDVLVVGGDNLFDFSLLEFIQYSRDTKPHPAIGTYDLNGRCRHSRYGIVKLDSEKKVVDFYEKPPRINGSRLISLCLYHFPKETLGFLEEYFGDNNNHDSIGQYIQWLTQRLSVYGYSFGGTWFDIGDIDSYTEAVCSF